MTTRKHDEPEFDRYAADYREMHKASTSASGEEPEYFAAYKAIETARRLGGQSQDPLRILDFGTGIGSAIPHLKRHMPNARLFGSDVSPESVRFATEQHGALAEFTTTTGSRLDYDDSSFDVVFTACVFHHIPVAERTHWMSELHRVVKPDGHLFVFEHNPLNPLTVRVVKNCPFDEDAVLLPTAELVSLSSNAGFRRVDKQYIVFFPKALSLLRPLEHSLGWLPLGAQYYVHARP